VAENTANQTTGDVPVERTWLFVGDFLFYLRLLARQFAHLARQHGRERKNMVIVPETSMAWEQLDSGRCEVVLLDCAETSESLLTFIREVRARHPEIRCVLVSAALNKKMESELMEAGAHLCFSKPRSGEEAGAVFQLVDALTSSKGFYPNGAFKGLAPARFIQFLCARAESGNVVMETDQGEASLTLEEGRIVDARLGELQGTDAAATILALDRTERCHFKHMLTSQYHTIQINTHQLWLDSDKIKARPAKEPAARKTAPAKTLSETMAGLDALDKLSFNINLETEETAESAQGEETGRPAKTSGK
jgi:Response regulator containing a CheY-like receiver domain and an HTH DNA-binding domain